MTDRIPERPDLGIPGVPPPPDGGGPGRLPAPWRAIEAIPVFVLALIAATVITAPVALATESCGVTFVVGALALEVGFVVAVVAWVRLVSRAPLSALGLPRSPLGDLGLGAGAGLGLLVAGYVVLAAVQAVVTALTGEAPPAPEQIESCVRGGALLSMAPVVVVAAPIAEETFFRGFLYRGLRRRMATASAALVSGIVFGVTHFAGASFLLIIPALTVVGFGLALLYETRGSLLAPISAHAVFNLFGFVQILADRGG